MSECKHTDGDAKSRLQQWIHLCEQSNATGEATEIMDAAIARIEALEAQLAERDSNSIDVVANRVCKHIPGDCVISLCMENGAAWVELGKDRKGRVDLPDSADKTLIEQLNDALCVANCWGEPRLPEPPKGEG